MFYYFLRPILIGGYPHWSCRTARKAASRVGKTTWLNGRLNDTMRECLRARLPFLLAPPIWSRALRPRPFCTMSMVLI